jgi:hypothetical protein
MIEIAWVLLPNGVRIQDPIIMLALTYPFYYGWSGCSIDLDINLIVPLGSLILLLTNMKSLFPKGNTPFVDYQNYGLIFKIKIYDKIIFFCKQKNCYNFTSFLI